MNIYVYYMHVACTCVEIFNRIAWICSVRNKEQMVDGQMS